MLKKFIIAATFLGTNSLLAAEDYLWIQIDKENSVLWTFGGNAAKHINAVIAGHNAKNQHVKCGVDSNTDFEICQLYFEKQKFSDDFELNYYQFNRDALRHSDTNSVQIISKDSGFSVIEDRRTIVRRLLKIGVPITCNTLSPAYGSDNNLPKLRCNLDIDHDGRVIWPKVP